MENDSNPLIVALSREVDILNNVLESLEEQDIVALGNSCRNIEELFHQFGIWDRYNNLLTSN